MIRNYLKIAWRNIINRKFYTFLNISGLAIAISCSIFIYLYTSYNLSFDRYHKNSNNIFRIVYELHLKNTEYDKGASYGVYAALKTAAPQVQQGAFSVGNQSFTVTVNGDVKKLFKEENNVAFTNSDWFKLFSFKWIAGNPEQLNEPGNVVLRQKTAQKYFGNSNPIGRIILFNNNPIKVVGVINDRPYNTDLKSDIYLSFSSLLPLTPLYDKSFFTDWGYLGSKHSAFIALNNANQKDAVEKLIISLAANHHFKEALKYYTFKLLPLKELHFDTRYGGVIQKSLLWNLAIIGILIIAIAIINYINIVVAQQTKRGVEIGTRKVLGGSVKQIFTQFIIESLVTSLIAVVIAIIIVFMILPFVNTWLFTDEPIYILSYISLYLYAALMLVIITIGTGVYPAILLSRVSISQALKNNVLNLPAGAGRKVLVVFQNTVTQMLIVCTIIIITQVHYLKNTDIGFDRKSVVTIPTGKLSASQKEQFSESLKRLPAVQSFTLCLKPPSGNTTQGATVQFNNNPKWEDWAVRFAIGDSAYCRTFGLHIIAGRTIRDKQPVPEFMINEKMAAMLVGKRLNDVLGKKLVAGDVKGVIIGVIKDFNIKPLSEPIEPAVLLENETWQTNLAVKLAGEHTLVVLGDLQKIYQRILPDQVFSYQFVDEQVEQLYKKENIQQKLIWLAASIAIFISSLGLLGLISLIALQRTKEIGIRKILGATVTQISLMLSTDFMQLIMIAFMIASPVSWWVMNNWLQGFAYRITINWWVFALSGGIAVLIATFTISFQAVKAATANPVKSLKNE